MPATARLSKTGTTQPALRNVLGVCMSYPSRNYNTSTAAFTLQRFKGEAEPQCIDGRCCCGLWKMGLLGGYEGEG
jgi:hypothetical protein